MNFRGSKTKATHPACFSDEDGSFPVAIEDESFLLTYEDEAVLEQEEGYTASTKRMNRFLSNLKSLRCSNAKCSPGQGCKFEHMPDDESLSKRRQARVDETVKKVVDEASVKKERSKHDEDGAPVLKLEPSYEDLSPPFEKLTAEADLDLHKQESSKSFETESREPLQSKGGMSITPMSMADVNQNANDVDAEFHASIGVSSGSFDNARSPFFDSDGVDRSEIKQTQFDVFLTDLREHKQHVAGLLTPEVPTPERVDDKMNAVARTTESPKLMAMEVKGSNKEDATVTNLNSAVEEAALRAQHFSEVRTEITAGEKKATGSISENHEDRSSPSSFSSLSSFGVPGANEIATLSIRTRPRPVFHEPTPRPFFWRSHPRVTVKSYQPQVPKTCVSATMQPDIT